MLKKRVSELIKMAAVSAMFAAPLISVLPNISTTVAQASGAKEAGGGINTGSDDDLKTKEGTVKLTKPMKVIEFASPNENQIKIPAGQTLHYKDNTSGLTVWNNKYPKSKDFIANSSNGTGELAKDSGKNGLKGKGNKNKSGNGNILNRNKALMNKKKNHGKNQKGLASNSKKQSNSQNANGSLPRTSDAMNPWALGLIALVSIGVIAANLRALTKKGEQHEN